MSNVQGVALAVALLVPMVALVIVLDTELLERWKAWRERRRQRRRLRAALRSFNAAVAGLAAVMIEQFIPAVDEATKTVQEFATAIRQIED